MPEIKLLINGSSEVAHIVFVLEGVSGIYTLEECNVDAIETKDLVAWGEESIAQKFAQLEQRGLSACGHCWPKVTA